MSISNSETNLSGSFALFILYGRIIDDIMLLLLPTGNPDILRDEIFRSQQTVCGKKIREYTGTEWKTLWSIESNGGKTSTSTHQINNLASKSVCKIIKQTWLHQ